MDYSELRRVLLSKGEADEDRSGDHAIFFIEVGGRTYAATKFSHSAQGQISSGMLAVIARQMRLTTRELRQFVACPLGRQQWVERWGRRGLTWRKGG